MPETLLPMRGRLFYCTLFTIAFLFPGNTMAALRADYHFDECRYANGDTVTDNSASASHGTAQGLDSTGGGRVCRAADFSANGTSDYVTLPASVLNNAGDFTIALWINAPNTSNQSGGNDQQAILSGARNGQLNALTVSLPLTDDSITISLEGSNYSLNIQDITTSTWRHLAVTRTGNTLRVYVNGSLAATRNNVSTTALSISSLILGQKQGTLGGGFALNQDFEGLMDELLIFDSALAATDINNIYTWQAAGKNYDNSARECPFCPPIAEYRFEGCDWSPTAIIPDETGDYPGQVVQGARTAPGTDYDSGGICNIVNLLNGGTDYDRHVSLTANPIPLNSDWTLMMWINFPLTFTNHAKFGDYRYSVLAGGTNDLCWLRKPDTSGDISWGSSSTPDTHVRDFPDNLTGWHHLAFVGQGSVTKLYIDGAYHNETDYKQTGEYERIGSTSDPVTTTARQNIDTQIDEVKFFDSALSAARISTIRLNEAQHLNWDGSTRTCDYCPAFDHYEIHHDGQGQTCSPETVTIKACANPDCSQAYADPVTVTLSPTGWEGGDTKTFSGGIATYQLLITTASTVTLGMSASDPSGPAYCFQSGVPASCQMTFTAGRGFLFDVPTLTACQPSAAVTISACGATLRNQTVNVGFWSTYINPPTGSKPLQINGTNIGASSPGTNIPLYFNNNSQSTFTVTYADAGQLQLDARYPGSFPFYIQLTGNDLFVTRPHSFKVEATTDGTTPLNNATDSGTPRVAAGADFQTKITAQCESGAVTPNFKWDTTLAAIAPFQPTSGTLGAMTINDGAPTIPAVSFSSGVATSSQTQYSEVGNMTISATASNYIESGISVSGATGSLVGRFIPDHFSVSPGSITNRSLAICSSPSQFTYAGEQFKLENFKITAYNALSPRTITQNYFGSYAKFDGASVGNFNFKAIDLADSSPPTTATAFSTGSGAGELNPLSSSGDWVGGVSVFTADLKLMRPTEPAAPYESFQVGLAPTDSDGVAVPASEMNLDTSVPSNTDDTVAVGNTKIRYGRLVLQNAYGPEAADHTMPLAAQYYMNNQWPLNEDDNCTALKAENFSFGNYQHQLEANEMDISHLFVLSSRLTLQNGKGWLYLTKPSSGDDGQYYGSVDVCADLGPDSGIGPTCVATTADMPFIQGKWPPDTDWNNDPTARVNFGLYRGNDRIINWREIMR